VTRSEADAIVAAFKAGTLDPFITGTITDENDGIIHKYIKTDAIVAIEVRSLSR
jgi:hypothetical protein